jgi:hypothetical protein
MAVPNDTTRFDTAFLVIWLLITAALCVMVVLRRITIANHVRSFLPFDARTLSYVFTFLQLCVFVFILAALAENSWAYSGGRGWIKIGLVQSRNAADHTLRDNGDCNYGDDGLDNWCRTTKAAGAFVLIFGIIVIFIAFILLLLSCFALAGRSLPALNSLGAHVPVLALLQFVLLLGMVMVWAVSGYDNLHQAFRGISLGASWALIFVAMVLSIFMAMWYSDGAPTATSAAAVAGGHAAHRTSQPPAFSGSGQTGGGRDVEAQRHAQMQHQQQQPHYVQHQQPQHLHQQQPPPVQPQFSEQQGRPEGYATQAYPPPPPPPQY